MDPDLPSKSDRSAQMTYLRFSGHCPNQPYFQGSLIFNLVLNPYKSSNLPQTVQSDRVLTSLSIEHTIYRLDMSSAEAGDGVSAANKGSWASFLKVSAWHSGLAWAPRKEQFI
jgi:hypothetical protein